MQESKINSISKNKELSLDNCWNNNFIKILKYAFYVYLAVALFLSTFGLFFIIHKNLQELNKYNLLFLAVASLFAIIIWYLCKKLKLSDSSSSFKKGIYAKFLIFGSIVIIGVMLFICFGRFFIAGWDVWYLYFDHPDLNNYFSVYPNNLFLRGLHDFTLTTFVAPICAFISYIIPAFSNMMKSVSSASVNYVLYVFLNVVCVYITILEISFITRKIINEKAAIFSFVLGGVFIGMMPWIAVPYSDVVAMMFVTSILASYVCIKKPLLKVCIICSITIFGYYIKPTIIFVTCAILLLVLVWLIRKFRLVKTKIKASRLNAKNTLIKVSVFVLTIVLCFTCVSAVKNCANVQIDEEKQFTSTHFLMMGLNTDKEGLWAQEDTEISSSEATVESREKRNIEVIFDRLNEMGPLGFFELMIKKTICNYGDGNFSWELDAGPNFYKSIFTQNPILNFYNDNYRPISQILWFAILIASIFSIAASRKLKSLGNNVVSIMCISLGLQSVFLMLFECGARYLILYLPFFVLLAVVGWTLTFHSLSKQCI